MKKSEIAKLENAGIIDADTANRIRDYYRTREAESTPKIFVIFGVIGCVLVGLGIISIFAHNWDELSRFTKTILAFVPLVMGQIACGYTLLRKKESMAWRESSAVFLLIAIGASISLISQIYNISGNISDFLLTWLLLALPLIYLLNSSVTSLFYWFGIVWYASETNFDYQNDYYSDWHWLLVLTALPHYYFLCKNKPESNLTNWHHSFIAVAGLVILATCTNFDTPILYTAYFSLFALYMMTESTPFFQKYEGARNSYLLIGFLGTIFLLFLASSHDFWTLIWGHDFKISTILTSREFIAATLLTIIALVILVRQRQKTAWKERPLEYIFLLFVPIFIIGYWTPKVMIFVNVLLLIISVLFIKEGLKKSNLLVLNLGLVILIFLVLYRFADTDINFTIKGIISILLGLGFFATNYYALRQNNKTQANGL